MHPQYRIDVDNGRIGKLEEEKENLSKEIGLDGARSTKEKLESVMTYYIFIAIGSIFITDFGMFLLIFIPIFLLLIWPVNYYYESKIDRLENEKRSREKEISKKISDIEEEVKKAEEEISLKLKSKKPKYSDIEWWLSMSPNEFEEEIAEYYRLQGADAEKTPSSRDGGFDVKVTKDNTTFLVECKRWKRGSKVSRPDLQKLLGAVVERRADYGVFVTTSDFTNDAKEYSKKVKIELINGERLTSGHQN